MFSRTAPKTAALALAAALGAHAPAAAQETTSPADAVLDRHLAAFAAHDVDAIMADYADKSIFVTPQRVFTGPDEIRTLFDGLIAEFSAPGATLTLEQRHSVGPVAYTVWSAETPQNSYLMATDTLYVEGDHILYQTFAAQITPK